MNVNYKTVLRALVLITWISTGRAQDAHSSIPIAWNPTYLVALTGATGNTIRGGIGYRTQWREYMEPYKTGGLFGDVALNGSSSEHWMAIGLSVLYDEASPLLRWTRINIQSSFHWFASNTSSMGVAIGLGYHQRSFLWNDNIWTESQITPNGPITTLPSNEPFLQNKISYIALTLGVIWLKTTFDGIKIALGSDLSYFNGIREAFINSDSSPRKKIRLRTLAHIEYPISDFASILGTIYGQLQGKANEVMVGLMYQQVFLNRYVSGKEKRIGGGLWLRALRSIAPSIVIGWEQVSLWITYDFWFGKIKNDIGWNGGMEVVARIDYPLGYFSKGSIVCPRF